VVIVNETTALRFWQQPANAIGRRVRLGDEWRTVIGVVRDIKYLRLNEGRTPYFYTPVAQDYRSEMTIHARGSPDSTRLINSVRAAIRSVDPDLSMLEAQTLSDQVRSSVALYEASAAALGAFGLIAIGLAAVGLYGLVSYSVKQRTHEIGLRIALGAGRADIARRFIAGGVRYGVLGVAIGTSAALMTTRVMAAILYGVTAMDPLTFAVAAGLVLGVAVLASVIPSWAATSTDPIRALRQS
jgi:ABC-type antimicrobial peptide transport system permease subunit